MLKLCPLLFLLLISCGVDRGQGQSIKSQIYGGTKSGFRDWPSVVSLNTNIKGSFCSGVAIRSNLILTAAHCLTESVKKYRVKQNVSIYYGRGRDSQYTGKYNIEEFGIHPDYIEGKSGSNFDFAYILLQQPLPISWDKIISPISYALSFEMTKIRQSVTLVGFGKRNDDNNGRKSSVDTTIWKTSNNEFYAGGGGHDTCFGDSGGAVFTTLKNGELRLIGITSRPVHPHLECGFGSIFGKINVAIDWLNQERIYR